MKQWYAVYTKPKSEDSTVRLLNNAGVETLAPKILRRKYRRSRYEEVAEQLFPCYIFAFFDNEEDCRTVKYARGVRYVVGRENPLPVHAEIIAAIRDRLEGDIVKAPAQQFRPGEPVCVDEGPFKDFYGVFVRDIPARRRVLILIEALHSRIEIEQRSVRKA
ncbi:MAG: hypothetical protein M0Z79_10250 [Nitrospiraceae bacterium]|nr:hypothetical protein [Nitrospiraceae bacterium]